jgi:hypothetical protein
VAAVRVESESCEPRGMKGPIPDWRRRGRAVVARRRRGRKVVARRGGVRRGPRWRRRRRARGGGGGSLGVGVLRAAGDEGSDTD